MKEFNWKEYIALRPDLKKNWNSPVKVWIHWILFGYREDRGKVYLINFFSSAIRNFFLQGSSRQSTCSKVGVIVTYHNNASRFTIPCLDSVLKHTPEPRFILAFDNESTEEEAKTLPEFYKGRDVSFIRIDDQAGNGGLTGTWNQGIDSCIKNNCDKIILLNYDTVVDESWKNFIQKIINDNACYGPVSNKPGWNKVGQKRTKEYSLRNNDSLKVGCVINGFCIGFTKKALILNKYNALNYFDPHFSFGGNEFEWQGRLRKKRGKSLVVEGCFVEHHAQFGWKDRAIIINQMLEGNKDTAYLEIGVRDGYSMKHVNAKIRIGVDPDMSRLNPDYISNKFLFSESKLFGSIFPKLNRGLYLHEMTSDEFFRKNVLKNRKIDIILIDGFYEYKQVSRDVENSLRCLNEGGIIVVRGCNPSAKGKALGGMGGNVWKVIVHLRSVRDDLNIFTLDMDGGLGIITKGSPEDMLPYSTEEVEKMEFEGFDKNRVKFLNLKKVDHIVEFLKNRSL